MTYEKSSGPLCGPKVRQTGRNCPVLHTIANISRARCVFRMWLKPATASRNVYHSDPAASDTTSDARRTKYIARNVLALTRR